MRKRRLRRRSACHKAEFNFDHTLLSETCDLISSSCYLWDCPCPRCGPPSSHVAHHVDVGQGREQLRPYAALKNLWKTWGDNKANAGKWYKTLKFEEKQLYFSSLSLFLPPHLIFVTTIITAGCAKSLAMRNFFQYSNKNAKNWLTQCVLIY